MEDVLLEPGVEILCPTCRQWHDVFTKDEAPATGPYGPVRFLYFRCHYAEGFAGTWRVKSRHPSRKSSAQEITVVTRHLSDAG